MVRMRCRMIRIGVPRIAARATHWSTSCHAASILGCGSSSQYVRVRLFRAYFNTRNLTATEHDPPLPMISTLANNFTRAVFRPAA